MHPHSSYFYAVGGLTSVTGVVKFNPILIDTINFHKIYFYLMREEASTSKILDLNKSETMKDV